MKTIAGDNNILHICSKNHNHMMYGSWEMERNRWNFFSFSILFGPFTLPQSALLPPQQTRKSKVWEHEKKTPGDIIILHKCTINDNHTWFLRYEARQTELFVILGHFLTFDPPNNPKTKNLKKTKKYLKISSFYTSAPKIMIICYTVPKIWCMMDVIVIFHFGLFFAILTPPSHSL